MTDFPDVARLVIEYLGALLAPVHVGSRVPHPRPAEFVQVRRIGGAPSRPIVDEARIDVVAWAADEGRAHDLASEARALMYQMGGVVGGEIVYRVVESGGPQSGNDPATGVATERVTFMVSVRANGVIHN